jgi:hypothetical protein
MSEGDRFIGMKLCRLCERLVRNACRSEAQKARCEEPSENGAAPFKRESLTRCPDKLCGKSKREDRECDGACNNSKPEDPMRVSAARVQEIRESKYCSVFRAQLEAQQERALELLDHGEFVGVDEEASKLTPGERAVLRWLVSRS